MTVKLGAKRAELVQLVQKFVPRSRVGIFRNERTKSNPYDLNSYFGPFHSVWLHLGLFHYGSKLRTKRTELVQLMQKLMP